MGLRCINKNIIKSKFESVLLASQVFGNPLVGKMLVFWLFMIIVIKTFVVYLVYRNLDPLDICLSYLASDILILFLVQVLITLNFFVRKCFLRIFINLLVFVVILIYCVNVFTIYAFGSNVPILDIFRVGSGGSAGFSEIITLWVCMFAILGALVFISVRYLIPKIKGKSTGLLLISSMFFLCYAAFYESLIIFDVNLDYVENIININLKSIGEGTDLKVDDTDLQYSDYIVETLGEGKNLNVILVFAESLSAIDSANVGGNNNMPKFDEIQRNGIIFTNFIANGATSDTAHIATFYGVVPLVSIGINGMPYDGYKLQMQPLAEFMNEQGYRTTFVSAASLDFLNQREFLSGVGFQKIIGEEEFERNKKYAFESAPDGDLYDRVLQEIQNQTGKYFIGLQTISFHTPYDSPYGKTESAALKYSDDMLYDFYKKLQQSGFFDNGILVILGDHRKMTPAESGERDIFGQNLYVRSVATVVGSGIEHGKYNTNLIQHTDFYNSIKKVVGTGNVKVDKNYNDIFGSEFNRDWGISVARYFTNKYIVSYLSGVYLFNNISAIRDKNLEVYNYFLSYINYELSDDGSRDLGDESMLWIGHQGARNFATENSLQSFLLAKEQGADGIEFDVSYTKDRKNIVAHGEYFYASNCDKLKIKDYEYDWIEENCTLKNGESYRTLKEMLEMVDGLFDYYFLEIKVDDEELGELQTLDAIQTVKELNMQDRVIFISYSNSARKTLNEDPDIMFGWDTFDVNDLDFIGENNSKYFLAPYDMLTSEVVENARLLGKQVVTYTVNDTGTLQDMKDLGINIILTDNIPLLKDYDSAEFLRLNLSKAVH